MSLWRGRAPRRGLALVLLLLLASCGAKPPADSEQTDDWQQITVGTWFKVRLPRDVVFKPTTSTSHQGFLINDRMQIHFSVGFEAGQAAVDPNGGAKTETALIGERRVTLIWVDHKETPEGLPASYVVHAWFDGEGDRESNMGIITLCATPADRAVAERIIRSVRFLPRRPSWLPAPPLPK